MRIGIVVATKDELRPFVEIFGSAEASFPNTNGYEVFRWYLGVGDYLYLILSGPGEIAAASSTQYLIDNFKVEGIINYGVAGGLSEEHTAGYVGVVERVVHTDFDITLSGHHVVGQYPHSPSPYIYPAKEFVAEAYTEALNKLTCASADKFVAGGEPKARLRREFGADVCEMEAAGIIITCNRNNIPVTLIKAVSDGANEDAEAFENNVYLASKSCVYLIATFVQHI